MARLTKDLIERLKAGVSLVRLIEAKGIALRREDKDWVGRCPFHADTGLSLVVNPATNQWQCRGDCRTGGSVIDWVMRAEGVSFRHAVELLRSDHDFADAPLAPVKTSTVRRLETPFTPGGDDQAVLAQVLGYYHETLKQSPEALAYLERRGLRSPEAVERFRLGYANRTLGYRLPEKNRREGAALRGQLQRLGILRASGHEHFAGALVMPVVDETGRVAQVYGRKIRDDLREGTAYHLYLPGPRQGVWNPEAFKAAEEIILCKSLIDALTFWCAGYRNVTAAYGLDGFTDDHLAAFRQHGTKRVLIAFGRNEPGEQATQLQAKRLMAEGIDCYRIELPKGMDVNDYALKVQPAAKGLGIAIRKAAWLGKGKAPGITTPDAATDIEPELVRTKPAQTETAETKERQESPRTAARPSETAKKAEAAEASPAAMPSISDETPGTPIPEPLPAAVMPAPPRAELAAEVHDDEVITVLGDRRYRIRGLNKNLSYDQIRINLLVSRPAEDGVGEAIHVDTFDLYSARHRAAFARQAGIELRLKEDVVKKDLGRLLLKLEALQDQLIKQTLAPKEKTVALDEAEREAALGLLKEPNLLERILLDFARTGIVGEETNKLVGYLAATSRKLDAPLAVIVQSSSAAGKSSLMEAVLAFVPEEDKVQYSAMTGQSLFYMERGDLHHKILALAEEEGVARASYALKLLQSEGALTIASTGKDPQSGKLVTHEYRVEGPVMIFSTTTAIDRDEELLNRCLILGVDESRAQTQAIHRLQRQRRTLEGLLARKDREKLLKLHRNAQRLLRPIAVMNPYAERLTFRDDRTRLRRDHEKYLTLIDTIALLHQYQRPAKTALHDGEPIHYVEVTLRDIEVANRLAHEVLGRTLDELAPQTRRLLTLVEEMVQTRSQHLQMERADYRFTRKDVREHTGWSDFQVKVHMHKLEELEYVLVHKGGRGQSFVYELLYNGEGKQGQAFVMGLLDTDRLAHTCDGKKEHPSDHLEVPSSPQVGAEAPGSSAEKNPANTLNDGVSLRVASQDGETAYPASPKSAAPDRNGGTSMSDWGGG